MSVPTGSDASTDSDGSSHEPIDGETDDPNDGRDGPDLHDPAGATDSGGSVLDTVTDWGRHWQAWGIAALSLAVVGWAAFLQPQTSPKGYIPIFLGFAALAVGYVYLDEETQIRLTSG
jgi:hypothetical protein